MNKKKLQKKIENLEKLPDSNKGGVTNLIKDIRNMIADFQAESEAEIKLIRARLKEINKQLKEFQS